MSGVFARGSKHYKRLSRASDARKWDTDPWALKCEGIEAGFEWICKYLESWHGPHSRTIPTLTTAWRGSSRSSSPDLAFSFVWPFLPLGGMVRCCMWTMVGLV